MYSLLIGFGSLNFGDNQGDHVRRFTCD